MADASIQFDCVPQATQATCVPRTALPEGQNALTGTIRDAAGNTSDPSHLALVIDTIPPALPPLASVSISVGSDGQVTVSVGDGAVEPFARVHITNLRTGETRVTVASATGAFALTLPGRAGDDLAIVLSDAATNASSVLKVKVPEDGVALVIDYPTKGLRITGDRIAVHGFLLRAKHPNTGISVNGVPAIIAANGEFAANDVPLVAGQNSLEVVARTTKGAVASAVLPVTSDGVHVPVRVDGSLRQASWTPVQYEYYIEATLEDGYVAESFNWDEDGDGHFEYRNSNQGGVQSDQDSVGKSKSGLYSVGFGWDLAGEAYYRHYFVIRTNEQVVALADSLVRETRDALAAGDVATASAMFVSTRRDGYSNLFAQLGLAAAESFDGAGTPLLGRSSYLTSKQWMEFVVPVVRIGLDIGFILRAQLDSDGVWRIKSL